MFSAGREEDRFSLFFTLFSPSPSFVYKGEKIDKYRIENCFFFSVSLSIILIRHRQSSLKGKDTLKKIPSCWQQKRIHNKQFVRLFQFHFDQNIRECSFKKSITIIIDEMKIYDERDFSMILNSNELLRIKNFRLVFRVIMKMICS